MTTATTQEQYDSRQPMDSHLFIDLDVSLRHIFERNAKKISEQSDLVAAQAAQALLTLRRDFRPQ